MAVWIASDLHFEDCEEPLFVKLISKFRSNVEAGDHVVFAGDVFDLFVGAKKVFSDRYAKFTEFLMFLSERGAQIHYIQGNHDFNIQKVFKSVPTLKVYESEMELTEYDHRIYIAHGDLADPLDFGYLSLRKILRSHLTTSLIEKLPDSWIVGVGGAMKSASRKKNEIRYSAKSQQSLAGALEVPRLSEAMRKLARLKFLQGFDLVVMGHSHIEDEVRETLSSGQIKQYINMGFPKTSGKILCLSRPDTNAFKRVEF